MPGVFGVPVSNRPPIYLRQSVLYAAGSQNPGNQTLTLPAPPLPKSTLITVGFSEAWVHHSAGVADIASATGYTFRQAGCGLQQDRNYPLSVISVGRPTGLVPPGQAVLHSWDFQWPSAGIFEFVNLAGEDIDSDVIDYAWATDRVAGVPLSRVKERGLLALFVATNDSGGAGPSGISGGWNLAMPGYLGSLGWKILSAGEIPSCTMTCVGRSSPWSGRLRVMR